VVRGRVKKGEVGAGLWVSGGVCLGRSCGRLAVVDLQSRFVVATLLCVWRIGGGCGSLACYWEL
jgi:hypothetical protein